MEKLRGMFSFALWDDREKNFLCARDRFGIKPFYYTIVDGVFYFASEIKALLPFLKMIETNGEALDENLGKDLLDAGIDTIIASIDATNPDTQSKIRVGLHYEKVVNNFENIIKLRNKNNKKT